MAAIPQTTSRWRSLAQFFAQVAPECLAARRDEFIADAIARRRHYRATEIIDGFRGPEHDSLPDDYWRMGEMAWHWSTLTFEMQSFFIEVLVEAAPPLPIEEAPPVEKAPPSVLLIEEEAFIEEALAEEVPVEEARRAKAAASVGESAPQPDVSPESEPSLTGKLAVTVRAIDALRARGVAFDASGEEARKSTLTIEARKIAADPNLSLSDRIVRRALAHRKKWPAHK